MNADVLTEEKCSGNCVQVFGQKIVGHFSLLQSLNKYIQRGFTLIRARTKERASKERTQKSAPQKGAHSLERAFIRARIHNSAR